MWFVSEYHLVSGPGTLTCLLCIEERQPRFGALSMRLLTKFSRNLIPRANKDLVVWLQGLGDLADDHVLLGAHLLLLLHLGQWHLPRDVARQVPLHIQGFCSHSGQRHISLMWPGLLCTVRVFSGKRT